MNEISKNMRWLKLDAMADEYDNLSQSNRYSRMTAEEAIRHLIDSQVDAKKNKTADNKLSAAKLEYETANLNNIDYAPSRKINRQLIQLLGTNEYITQHHDVIVLGATGSGKSYIASAIGRRACDDGYSVRYITLDDLILAMVEAEINQTLKKTFKKFCNYDLLIIDEFLTESLADHEISHFSKIMDKRAYKKATIYVTQKPVTRWHEALGGEYRAEKIIDRIKNNSYRLTLKGESQRKLRSTIQQPED
jgi:DNA replication protein DnaC